MNGPRLKMTRYTMMSVAVGHLCKVLLLQFDMDDDALVFRGEALLCSYRPELHRIQPDPIEEKFSLRLTRDQSRASFP